MRGKPETGQRRDEARYIGREFDAGKMEAMLPVPLEFPMEPKSPWGRFSLLQGPFGRGREGHGFLPRECAMGE